MFHLRVQLIGSVCVFDLSWGKGQRLSKTLKFSAALESLYQDWQRAYLSFYRTAQIPAPTSLEAIDAMRGKAVSSGIVTASRTDWHAKLVEAETRLLYQFHRWLRQEELFDLYTAIAQVSKVSDTSVINIYLTCTPIELTRLPWEAWELGASFATNRTIRIIRVPLNIRQEASSKTVKHRRIRPRILVILGNDPHQNFAEDWQHLKRSLHRLADIPEPVGWKEGKPIDELKTEISRAIADSRGWDVLFFAGHSNETALTGGELGIAPNVSIRISEIAPQLAIAKERGLQFALFNSCSGLNLAESLIDLGLSQVAVMSEPVHNRVAQEFLVQFLQALAEHNDVHEALLAACHYLKTEKNLTYPSAYLIPSLFCQPDVELFQIKPINWRSWAKQLVPKWYEAAALSTLLLLSWQLPVQDWLLGHRLEWQARYRQWTQRTVAEQPAPVLLVQVDGESLARAGISDPHPIPYSYLAELIENLAVHQPQLVGIDYLLDRPREDVDRLGQVVQQATAEGTQFVFATAYENNAWQVALPQITNGNPSADMGFRRYHMDFPRSDTPKPLAFVLAELYANGWQTNRTKRSPITSLSYRLHQRWLDPIVDYSLPPSQIYTAVSAWTIIQQANPSELQYLSQQVILIVPGGYAEAGLAQGQDNFTAPQALRYWYQQQDRQGAYRKMTGGEAHAYKLHHLLRQHMVIPIPDLWLMLLAAGASKGIVLIWQQRSPKRWIVITGLISSTGLYALLSLELYLSSLAIMLPIALPVAVVWLYVLPPYLQKLSIQK
jgi:hypothetical protein